MRIRNISRHVLALSFISMLLPSLAWGGQTIDAGSYRLEMQKEVRVDVVTAKGGTGFRDAAPRYRSGRTSEFAPMFTSRTRATQAEVIDALGRGTCLTFPGEGRTWEITVYSGTPFLTARVTYENTGREAEQVGALCPWSSVDGCTVGADTNLSVILDNGNLFSPQAMLRTPEEREVVSLWNLAVHNLSSGRSVIAGFLTNERAYAQIHVLRNADPGAAAFQLFQAECLYDPPVELAPGERLTSELLYLSVAEDSPLEGLERFAASVAAFNGLQPTRRALPHGWDSWVSHYHKDITEKEMRAELDFMDKHLKRYGWTHFSIDDGWQKGAGDWEADPERFPGGMKAFADEVHKRGMTAALWTEPFTVNVETPLAKEHPEWLAGPGMLGKSLLAEDERILDITAPGAYDQVRSVYRKITDEWGYDGLVEIDFVYHLLAAKTYADPKATRAEALRKGIEAIREGAGPETFIMGVAPFPITGMVADGMRTGIDCGPIWRNVPDQWCWGCVDTLTNAARRYYFAPRVFALDQDCVFFGHEATRKRWKVTSQPELTRDQQLAWMTGAALTGGAVKLGEAPTLLTPAEVDVLRRLLPVMPQPARPVDLFERKEPRVWVLPIDCAIGKWQIVGMFNWNASAAETIPLSLAQLGLEPGVEYAVFDFWPGEYCGRAKDKMNLDVGAGSVRLLSFRPYEKRPMFLATDSHISQGATDFEALDWNSNTRTLSGRFRGIEDTDYKLSVLIPEGFAPKETSVSTGKVKVTAEAGTARLEFHCDAAGPVDWHVTF